MEVDDPPLQFDFLAVGFSTDGSLSVYNSTVPAISNRSSVNSAAQKWSSGRTASLTPTQVWFALRRRIGIHFHERINCFGDF